MKAINAYQWRNREGLVKRGMRMLRANWTNRLESTDLERWFNREMPKYCAVYSGANTIDNRQRLFKRFVSDCSKWLTVEYYGYNLEDFS